MVFFGLPVLGIKKQCKGRKLLFVLFEVVSVKLFEDVLGMSVE